MFNFHLLAIAQHYAWKSSLGFLARKILAVTVGALGLRSGFKKRKHSATTNILKINKHQETTMPL
jgi:hypothetical protein